jgi:hypothetical protein
MSGAHTQRLEQTPEVSKVKKGIQSLHNKGKKQWWQCVTLPKSPHMAYAAPWVAIQEDSCAGRWKDNGVPICPPLGKAHVPQDYNEKSPTDRVESLGDINL